jgi:sporulation protein YlmC with PRC-barrel domain
MEYHMNKLASAVAIALLMGSGAALGQSTPPAAQIMSAVPSDAIGVSNYTKQNVYDPSDKKIGDIADVLLDTQGRVVALIISVGGFLGMGEKDVAVPFNAVQLTQKNNKSYLVMNTTKDALKNARGLKYDRTATKWVPDTK